MTYPNYTRFEREVCKNCKGKDLSESNVGCLHCGNNMPMTREDKAISRHDLGGHNWQCTICHHIVSTRWDAERCCEKEKIKKQTRRETIEEVVKIIKEAWIKVIELHTVRDVSTREDEGGSVLSAKPRYGELNLTSRTDTRGTNFQVEKLDEMPDYETAKKSRPEDICECGHLERIHYLIKCGNASCDCKKFKPRAASAEEVK